MGDRRGARRGPRAPAGGGIAIGWPSRAFWLWRSGSPWEGGSISTSIESTARLPRSIALPAHSRWRTTLRRSTGGSGAQRCSEIRCGRPSDWNSGRNSIQRPGATLESYFLVYGRDTRNGALCAGNMLEKALGAGVPPWMDTNRYRINGYLGRVNLVSLLPSALLVAGLMGVLAALAQVAFHPVRPARIARGPRWRCWPSFPS